MVVDTTKENILWTVKLAHMWQLHYSNNFSKKKGGKKCCYLLLHKVEICSIDVCVREAPSFTFSSPLLSVLFS